MAAFTEHPQNFSSIYENGTAGNASEEYPTAEQLLKTFLGARHRNMVEAVILTIVYSVIFLTGVVGNVSTCIVITKNSYMHTATNYYLFSLAISDVLTLILGLPPEVYTIWEAYPWRFGLPYCLFKTFLTEMTSSASVLTITAFTIERYEAICHPIRAQTMFSLNRAIKIVLGIWVLACLTALPYPVHTRTYYYVYDPYTNKSIPDSLICNIPTQWRSRMRYVFQASSFVLFIFPMAVITALYILIGLTLRRSGLARQTSADCAKPQRPSQSRRAVLKMLGAIKPRTIIRRLSGGSRRRKKESVHEYLVAVVVAFFICWAPYHAQRLMTVYISDTEWTSTLLEIQSILFYSSGILYFVSSTVNPILYNLMSKKYRQAFKETLCRCSLTAEERRQGDARLRGYYFSERSTTYVSVAGGNTTRLLPDRGSIVRHHRQTPMAGQHGTYIPGSKVNRANCLHRETSSKKNKTNTRWGSWKEKLLSRNKKEPTRKKPPVVHANYAAGLQHRAANGGTGIYSDATSHSASSSPERTAADIREELELSDVELPTHQQIICPRTGGAQGDGNSGTLL